MILRFLVIIVILSLFVLNPVLVPKKIKPDHPLFQELWSTYPGPVYGERYFDCLDASGVDSQHEILFMLKTTTENKVVSLVFEIENLSTKKVFSRSPTISVTLNANQPFGTTIPVKLPGYCDPGFYYAKLYINGEFADYRNYNNCAGNMIAYK